MSGYAGYTETLEWVPTAEVRVGDRIACLLSDAHAFLPVTGWDDKTLDLTRYGSERPFGIIVHRVFTVTNAPWWAGEDMRTGDLAGPALIVKRGTTTTEV